MSAPGRLVLALVGGLALLAIALAIGLFAVADGIRDRTAGDTISVTGSAKRSITSDFVIWEASVSAQGLDPAPAAAQLARWCGKRLRRCAPPGSATES